MVTAEILDLIQDYGAINRRLGMLMSGGSTTRYNEQMDEMLEVQSRLIDALYRMEGE